MQHTRSGRCYSELMLTLKDGDLLVAPLHVSAGDLLNLVLGDGDDSATSDHEAEVPSTIAVSRTSPSSNSQSGKALSLSPNASHESKKKLLKKIKRSKRRSEKQLASGLSVKDISRKRVKEAFQWKLTLPFDAKDHLKLNLSKPGWIGLKESLKSCSEYSLANLMKLGMRLIQWDGRTPHPLVDRDGRVFAMLVGTPRDDGWNSAMTKAAALIESARGRLCVPPQLSSHRRGNFPALATGISHGGGQKSPGMLVNTPENGKVLEALLSEIPFQRISGFTDSVFRASAFRLHSYYKTTLDAISAAGGNLQPAYPKSAFAACTVNFGPRTVTRPHRDFANLAWGWCAITALGSYDPDIGGHLVLSELGYIVRFPPGSTVLIPSAMITHSNTPVSENETRYSFAQYSAAGLFRWAENGFQTQRDLLAKASVDDLQRWREAQETRWARGLSMLSSVEELSGPM